MTTTSLISKLWNYCNTVEAASCRLASGKKRQDAASTLPLLTHPL